MEGPTLELELDRLRTAEALRSSVAEAEDAPALRDHRCRICDLRRGHFPSVLVDLHPLIGATRPIGRPRLIELVLRDLPLVPGVPQEEVRDLWQKSRRHLGGLCNRDRRAVV